jgi:hypothetical protein
MIATPEPFLTAEIEYRQQQVADLYRPNPKGRRWVPRRPHLTLPHRKQRPLAVA